MDDIEPNRHGAESKRLIDRVARRMRLASFGNTWASAVLLLGVAGFILLLIRRLSGLGPDWFTVEALVVVSISAALIALLFSQGPTNQEAARRIDRYCDTSDLFLTVTQLDSSAGGYQLLVLEQAELTAAEVLPRTVVEWNWQRPVVRVLVGAAWLVSAVLFVPQFDPFGTVDIAKAEVAVRKDLQQSRRETASRIAEISTKKDTDGLTAELNTTLLKLAEELQKFDGHRSPLSPTELSERQREIQTQWRNLRSDDEVSRLMEQASTSQSFGPVNRRVRQWTQELVTGNTDSLDRMFEDLNKNLERLYVSKDKAERRELDVQARKELAELQRFAENQLRSTPMKTALKRAANQLNSGRLEPSLQSEATAAAKESVELAQAEMRNIAQDTRNLASLEKALDAIQSARRLVQDGARQGAAENQATIQEFIDQYARLQGDANEGQGADQRMSRSSQSDQSDERLASSAQPGTQSSGKNGRSKQGGTTGGSGVRSSLPPENKLAKTDFREMRETAGIDAVRRLMALRRQGLADSGSSTQVYQDLVREVQKRVSTAIEVEEIPPGYVSGIRSYFNSLDQQSALDTAGGRSIETSNTPRSTKETSGAADNVR